MSLVSIITPLFNRAHLVNETWESIKIQTYPDWEWIVVDDGSTDDSFALMNRISETDSRVKVYVRTPELRKGPSSCRNYGARMSQGEYLIFVDSDDLLDPNCLKHRVAMMSANSLLDFAVFPMQYFSRIAGDRQEIFNRYLDSTDGYLKHFLTDKAPWQTMCPIWKKDSFQRLGGFNEHYTCMEDPELHIRALISDYRFQVIQSTPDCFYRYSFIENEKKNNFWRNSIEGRIAFLKDVYFYINSFADSESKKQLYFNYLSEFYLTLIKGFMLARLHEYQKEFNELLAWVSQKMLISKNQQVIMKLAYRVYSSNNKLVDLLRLRGVIYRLI